MCKLEIHHSAKRHNSVSRGYIAMLAVDKNYRRKKIGERAGKMLIVEEYILLSSW